ncbi:glycosyltransferase involved in cell wall biosynthesis [Salinibacter ruber]|uniref:glycosyltransferase n=1 Tax=Salinibacter ruber TaxID=146919 RepID=UPI002169639E|nr:glycosyltransferase [Salinibacter ruber]MCS3663489.1 glycosyltransferase involved in cell wall biosynthesis [Salinibacter ruber]
MNILFIVFARKEVLGGAKRALKMAPYLSDYSNVTIAINESEENKNRLAGIKNINSVFVERTGLFEYRKQLGRVIERKNPDIIYTNHLNTRTLFLNNKSFRIVEHAELFSQSEDMSYLQRLKYLMYEWTSIFISDGMLIANKNLEYIYKKRSDIVSKNMCFKYLPYGSSAHINQNKKKDNINDKLHTVLYFGSLSRDCGFTNIIDSIITLNRNSDKKITLEFCGSGKVEEKLKSYVSNRQAKGVVRFNGFIEESLVSEYLNSADVLLCPLQYKNRDKFRFPSKLPMYMNTGKPVVTCKLREVVDCLGDKGFYYEPGDVRSLCEAIGDALEYGNVEYDESNVQRYSWENISREFYKWVKKCLESEVSVNVRN